MKARLMSLSSGYYFWSKRQWWCTSLSSWRKSCASRVRISVGIAVTRECFIWRFSITQSSPKKSPLCSSSTSSSFDSTNYKRKSSSVGSELNHCTFWCWLVWSGILKSTFLRTLTLPDFKKYTDFARSSCLSKSVLVGYLLTEHLAAINSRLSRLKPWKQGRWKRKSVILSIYEVCTLLITLS